MNIQYTIWQWIAFFVVYSFIGWCYESTYVSIKHKKWVNRGFMRGPFLPLYGSGAVVMLFVSIPFRGNLVLTFLAGAVGATLLEYITGEIMEALFKVKYWDYTNRKFNFRGHICLAATCLWGVFTVLLVYLIHQPVENFIFHIPEKVLEVIMMLFATYVISDFSISFKTAMELRGVLIRLDEVKKEMQRYQKRMDVLLAFADDAKDQVVMSTYERFDELNDALEERLAHLKEIRERMDQIDLSEEIKEELEDLRIRIRVSLEKGRELRIPRGILTRSMLRNNPNLVSKLFRETLEDLKEATSRIKRK